MLRVREFGDGFGFALQPLPQRRIRGQIGGQNLNGYIRSRRVSRARYTSPMPPAPSGDRIS